MNNKKGALLLARLMGQYCLARCRLSATVVVCNAAGHRARGRTNAAGRVGAQAADTARRANTVTSR